jgi:hypothetical protein
MLTSHVKLVQARLKEMGDYAGLIDGDRGPLTNAALRRAFPRLPGPKPADWQGWSDKRVAVGFLQLWARAEGIEPGPIDGWWGPQTDFAAGALAQKIRLGTVPAWRDDTGNRRNPNGWPTESGVTAFFGPHGAADWSRPPPRLVKVPSPYPFRIAWNLRETRSFLWAHEKTADSVGRVLSRILTQYGAAEIRRLRLDVFSGDYFPRLKKGSATEWSMHSWGIAYDFDDTNNRLQWGADRAWLARPEYRDFWAIWEAEGWVSLGRARNFDWMHVQAAHLD